MKGEKGCPAIFSPKRDLILKASSSWMERALLFGEISGSKDERRKFCIIAYGVIFEIK